MVSHRKPNPNWLKQKGNLLTHITENSMSNQPSHVARYRGSNDVIKIFFPSQLSWMCFLFCFHSQVDPSPLIMWLLAAPAGFLGSHCHTVWRIRDQTDLGHVPSLNYNLEKRDLGLGAPAPAFPKFWRLRMVKGRSLRKNQNCYPNSGDWMLGSQLVNVYRYTANCFFTPLVLNLVKHPSAFPCHLQRKASNE